MKTDAERWRSASSESLRFFGAMSASVTHEIRNKLAVINEKAGLVEDIAAAMRSGRATDPDRLETQARKIVEQIRQANRIVSALNRLAHSTDQTEATVDAADLVALVVELHGRKAAMAQTTIAATDPESHVPLRTNPFLLANAIGVCLGLAVSDVDESRTLGVTTEPTEDGARVRILGLAKVSENEDVIDRTPPGLDALLDILDGDLEDDRRRGEIVLEIRHSNPGDHGGQP
jgi:C4-dicarboxylate-specific signal transduction histidine kinase